MKKYTAVETLVFLLELEIGDLIPDAKLERIHKIISHAKEIEKKQIINAYLEGESDGDHFKDSGLIFYNKKFGGEK